MRIPGLHRLAKIRKQVKLNKIAPKMSFEPNLAFSLFSDPRGGSTWLTELLLDTLDGVEVIWEPLNISTVPIFEQLEFSWRQYIPENHVWKDAKNAFEQVFQGKILNNWIAYMTSPAKLANANGLFVKFCRGNALLPWLVNQFDFKYKPIYMVRHPFAVVASQLKQGGWDYEYTGFNYPKGPFAEYMTKHRTFLDTLETKEESLVAVWCMSNKVALEHPQNNVKWLTLTYEEMILDPLTCLERIFKAWGMAVDYQALEQKVNKPSSTTVKGSAIAGTAQIEQWTKRLTEEQQKRLQRVLTYFDINVYTNDPYPVIKFNETK